VDQAGALIGLLADDDRLRVVAALALGHEHPKELIDVTGLDARRVARAIGRLAAGGLVETDADGRCRLRADRFRAAARDAAEREPAAESTLLEGFPAATAAVARNFFDGSRLRSIPTQRSKRLAVLDVLAAKFEPGRVYPERDVNFLLGTFHDDVAALRRYLVDEDFLERRDAFYWRTGGTFDV